MADVLTIWTVYLRPLDYPDKVVVRPMDITPDGQIRTHPTPHLFDTVEQARDFLQDRHLTNLGRSPIDEPQIVESWI